MNELNKYRYVCINYLLSRVRYFNEPADEVLDTTYRKLKGLPARPSDDDQFNGLLGHKPVTEQREEILTLLSNELSLKKEVVSQDLVLDSIVRYINKLKKRTSKVPYVDLFTIDNVEIKEVSAKANPYKNASYFSSSQDSIDLMHKYEGYRECTYKDPGSASGLPITGGYGSTRLNGKKLSLGQCYSKEIWTNQFKQDLIVFENAVKRHVKVPITQGMFDALVSTTYNIGEANLMSSTFLKRLNEEDYKGCVAALQWWVKGANGKKLPGLIARRKSEGELFFS